MKTDRKEYIRQWKLANKEKTKSHWRKFYLKLRRECLMKIGDGKIECSRCGEQAYGKLQINHIKGGGRKDKLYRTDKLTFFRSVLRGERDGEFNILCQACNYLHLAEMLSGKKYGEVK